MSIEWMAQQIQRQQRYRKLQPGRSAVDPLRVIDALRGTVSAKDVAQYYGIHQSTARAAIRQAITDGVLEMASPTKNGVQARFRSKV
jgi:transposase